MGVDRTAGSGIVADAIITVTLNVDGNAVGGRRGEDGHGKRERQEFKKQARGMAQAELLVSQVREMTRAVRDQVTVERQQNLKTSIRFSKRH